MLPGEIQAITFDCYGTLIDWERGIADYVAPMLQRTQIEPAEWVERWEKIQLQMLVPYRPYRARTSIATRGELVNSTARGGAWSGYWSARSRLRRKRRLEELSMRSESGTGNLIDVGE